MFEVLFWKNKKNHSLIIYYGITSLIAPRIDKKKKQIPQY